MQIWYDYLFKYKFELTIVNIVNYDLLCLFLKSCDLYWQPSVMSADFAVTTILTTLIVADIIGNCLVIFVISRNRDMRYAELITNDSIYDFQRAVNAAIGRILSILMYGWFSFYSILSFLFRFSLWWHPSMSVALHFTTGWNVIIPCSTNLQTFNQ